MVKKQKMKITQSSIRLHNMRFYAYHGVLEQERRVGGEYLVSLCAEVDFSKPVVSDCVDDTLNYADVYSAVAEEMAQPSNLLEHVAGRIGQRVLDSFPQVEALQVSVTKCNPPMGADCQGASVEIKVKR